MMNLCLSSPMRYHECVPCWMVNPVAGSRSVNTEAARVWSLIPTSLFTSTFGTVSNGLSEELLTPLDWSYNSGVATI